MKYELKQNVVGPKDYNTQTIINFISPKSSDIDKMWDEYSKTKIIDQRLKDIISRLYLDGLGFKIIANSIKKCTYSKIRVFIYAILEKDQIRKGNNVSTSMTKKLRSQRMKNSSDNPWSQDDYERPSKGIQGYYYVNDKKFWLRSTYEYIFIKWLLKNNISFKCEYKTYILSDGSKYRPDFFIFECDKITSIIEIKGSFYTNNIHKPSLLQEHLKESNIQVKLIDDISPYTEYGYLKELAMWKEYLNETKQKINKGGVKN